jgi:hypothetical protein
MASMGPIDRAQRPPRGSEFVFARLRYDSGDWDYNPKVAANQRPRLSGGNRHYRRFR